MKAGVLDLEGVICNLQMAKISGVLCGARDEPVPFTHCSSFCRREPCKRVGKRFGHKTRYFVSRLLPDVRRFLQQPPTPRITQGWCPRSTETRRAKVTLSLKSQAQRLNLLWVSFCTRWGLKKNPNNQQPVMKVEQDKESSGCSVTSR